MKKLIQFIKEKKGYFLAFLIPFSLFILLFILLRVLFFNKYVGLVSDMKAQYYPLLYYFKEILQGKHSIFYAAESGFGANFFGTFAYYLISPFNFLVLFFSDTRFHYVPLLISILKLSTSGLTMFHYLKKHYKDKKDIYLLIFSISYALMSYNIAYYFHILWLDSLYLLPLMCLGIDNIIEKKKSGLYGISLFLSILCNYYIGYMMCIFSVLYFIYELFIKYTWKEYKKEIINAIILYGITSLFAGLSAMVVLLPSLLNVMQAKSSPAEVFSKGVEITSPFETFSKIYLGSHAFKNSLGEGGPFLYIGNMMLVLIFLYFLNKHIKKREKWLSFGMIGVFLLSFSINYLSNIWHGMNVPVCFNYRFAFLFNFFLLILCAKAFFKKDGNKKIHYYVAASILPVFSFCMLFQSFSYLELKDIYISVGFYLFYCLVLYAYHLIKEEKQEKLYSYLLLFLVIGELFLNAYSCLEDYLFGPRDENYGYMETMKKQFESLKDKENSFKRIEKDFEFTQLDSLFYGYYGISSFLSTIPESTISFWNAVSYNEYMNTVKYTGGFPPILDSTLGIKYFVMKNHGYLYGKEISRFSFSKYSDYLYGAVMKDYVIYENPYAMSLGFMTSENYKGYENTSKNQPSLSVQQLFLQSLLGTEDCALKANIVERVRKNTYQFVLDTDEIVYFDFFKTYEGNDRKQKQIYINDELYYQYIDNEFTGFSIKSDRFQKGDTITIRFEHPDPEWEVTALVTYIFDEELFASQINKLKEHELVLETFKDGYIKGKVTATEEMPILFLSVPNEDGWAAKVDGKEAEIKTIYDTFIGIELSPGEHEVELSFHVPGLKIGALISGISILLWILFAWKKRQVVTFFSNLYFKHMEIWNYILVGVLTTVVNLFIYLVLKTVFHTHYMVNTVVAWILSVLFAYIANKYFVFEKKSENRKDLLKECFEFFKYRIYSLILELGLMYFLVSILHKGDSISKIFVNIIVIILNYVFSKLFVFKKYQDK